MSRDDQRPRKPGAVRCAIYTRKSTEEGLDLEFNSLDAQREACAAYVSSQRHEGWSLSPDNYDDGGYSGGNMDRPGLQRLLADVRGGTVDVIVVYKVDRLTRALSDFSKIVDILDAAGASFVSITQAFNTTTSMGRLTLNVLLSFAQFEREVISERVRDKIAASKRKGIWMGGTIPIGYDVVDRKLVINEREAETVRHIFRRYLEVGSVRALMAALGAEGVRTKVQTMRDGSKRGGVLFARGPLYCLLKNPVYVGRIPHKKESHPGQHKGLVPQELWERVQRLLVANAADRRLGKNATEPSLLAGMIYDTQGHLMTPSHAKKGPRRYRYYVSGLSDNAEHGDRPLRIPAGEIERLVRAGIAEFLGDAGQIANATDSLLVNADDQASAIAKWGRVALDVPKMATHELRELFLQLDANIAIGADTCRLTYAARNLLPERAGGQSHPERTDVLLPGILMRRGQELRLILTPRDGVSRAPNPRLVALIAKGFAARTQLLARKRTSQAQKAHLCRTARTCYLAPDIMQAILDGRQPENLKARGVLRVSEMPWCWEEQRRVFGFRA